MSDSPPDSVRSFLNRTTPLAGAQWLWRFLELPRDWSPPGWYCNYYGTSPWHLARKFNHRDGERKRGLAFIVRMNYLMDTDFNKSVRLQLPNSLGKRLSALGLEYSDILNSSANVTWAHSTLYNWRRVLSCTLRNFSYLAFPLFEGRLRSVPSDLLVSV